MLLWWPSGRAQSEPVGSALARLEAEQQALYEQVAPSVVLLGSTRGLGSGFVVTADGLVLTNRHVVGDETTLEAVLLDGRKGTAVVVRTSDDLDLALVRLAGVSAPPLRLVPTGDVDIGAWVASVGHGAGGGWTFTTGMVTNIYPAGRGRAVFQTQLPVNPGNSGGPVVDRTGAVIGMVTAGLAEAQVINFAIRSDEMLHTFEELDAVCGCLVVTSPANVPVFLDGRPVGTGPRLTLWPTTGVHELSAVIAGQLVKRPAPWPDAHRVSLEAR